MTFVFEKERITAISSDGAPMGYITFPRIRDGLVNINHIVTYSPFRNQGVADSLMDALLAYLRKENQKAALTCPYAQQYMARHPQWKAVLPGSLHCVTH